MTVPEDHRDLRRAADRQHRRDADRPLLSTGRARARSASRQYFAWFIIPAAIDGLLIAILAVVVQVLSPNKYVGWGIIFVWFVGGIFLTTWVSNPLYTYGAARRAAERFRSGRAASGSGRRSSVLLAVLRASFSWCIAHCCGRAGPTLGCASGSRRMPRHATAASLGDRRGCRRRRWPRPAPTPTTTSSSSTVTRPTTSRNTRRTMRRSI